MLCLFLVACALAYVLSCFVLNNGPGYRRGLSCFLQRAGATRAAKMSALLSQTLPRRRQRTLSRIQVTATSCQLKDAAGEYPRTRLLQHPVAGAVRLPQAWVVSEGPWASGGRPAWLRQPQRQRRRQSCPVWGASEAPAAPARIGRQRKGGGDGDDCACTSSLGGRRRWHQCTPRFPDCRRTEPCTSSNLY